MFTKAVNTLVILLIGLAIGFLATQLQFSKMQNEVEEAHAQIKILLKQKHDERVAWAHYVYRLTHSDELNQEFDTAIEK